jgi:hypothetical protein
LAANAYRALEEKLRRMEDSWEQEPEDDPPEEARR